MMTKQQGFADRVLTEMSSVRTHVNFAEWMLGASALRDDVLGWDANEFQSIGCNVAARGLVVHGLEPVDAYLVCYLARHEISVFGEPGRMTDGVEFRFYRHDYGKCTLRLDGEFKAMVSIRGDGDTERDLVLALINNMDRLHVQPGERLDLPLIGRAVGLTTADYPDIYC